MGNDETGFKDSGGTGELLQGEIEQLMGCIMLDGFATLRVAVMSSGESKFHDRSDAP